MIEDIYRNAPRCGELNKKPSMTEPFRVYSVNEILARPELVMRSRSSFAEQELDIGDPRSLDRLSPGEEVPDLWDTEVPRDPDFYNPIKKSRSTKSSKPQTKRASEPTLENVGKSNDGGLNKDE